MINKEDIVSRLFKENKITLEELLVLLDRNYINSFPGMGPTVITPITNSVFPDYYSVPPYTNFIYEVPLNGSISIVTDNTIATNGNVSSITYTILN